jgi:hypothetical protein
MVTVHSKGCSDARCGQSYALPIGAASFFCEGCERVCGYCMGCVDDMPELCDDCAAHVEMWRKHAKRLMREAS